MKDMSVFLNIVLVRPEIPSNTGNIGRTCVGTGSSLHLVGPLGFEINNKQLKRAGLDYWPRLSFKMYPGWESFRPFLKKQRVFCFSTKGTLNLYEARFQKGDFLIFGPESRGLPQALLAASTVVKIPVPGPVRSLNLANAVSIGIFEAYRQIYHTPASRLKCRHSSMAQSNLPL